MTRTDHRSSVSDHVWFLAFPGLQALDLTGPFEVFAAANNVANEHESRNERRPPSARYQLHVVSATPGPVATESGLVLHADPLPSLDNRSSAEGRHTLVVPGGDGARNLSKPDPVVEWVAGAGRRVDRLATVCTGAFLAAEAGLLEHRNVTTHWARAKRLQHQYPTLEVSPDAIYARDEHVWTSAGVTAGIDLALALVEDDMGAEVAQTIARWLVVFLRRPGGQSQFAPTVWTPHANEGPIRHAQELVAADPARFGSVVELAESVGLSPRHFTRKFKEETGLTPAHYLEQIRLSAARQQLEGSEDPLPTIAARCGFGTAETLRRAFHRHLDVSPDHYRKRFKLKES